MQAPDRRVPRNKTMDLEREILLPVEDGSHWLDLHHVVQRRVIRYLRTQASRLRQSNFIRLQNSLICDQKIDREALAPVFDRSLEVVFFCSDTRQFLSGQNDRPQLRVRILLATVIERQNAQVTWHGPVEKKIEAEARSGFL